MALSQADQLQGLSCAIVTLTISFLLKNNSFDDPALVDLIRPLLLRNLGRIQIPMPCTCKNGSTSKNNATQGSNKTFNSNSQPDKSCNESPRGFNAPFHSSPNKTPGNRSSQPQTGNQRRQRNKSSNNVQNDQTCSVNKCSPPAKSQNCGTEPPSNSSSQALVECPPKKNTNQNNQLNNNPNGGNTYQEYEENNPDGQSLKAKTAIKIVHDKKNNIKYVGAGYELFSSADEHATTKCAGVPYMKKTVTHNQAGTIIGLDDCKNLRSKGNFKENINADLYYLKDCEGVPEKTPSAVSITGKKDVVGVLYNQNCGTTPDTVENISSNVYNKVWLRLSDGTYVSRQGSVKKEIEVRKRRERR